MRTNDVIKAKIIGPVELGNENFTNKIGITQTVAVRAANNIGPKMVLSELLLKRAIQINRIM